MEKNKQWKNELLMEQLRLKSSKTLIELAKGTRLNLLERRYNIDAVEKQTLQTALDNLQNNISIKNRSNLVERLESISRRSLLKFTDNAHSLFISSDMFYLEILLDPQSGKVNDVKVHHECSNESESEPYLIDVLRKGDFIDFTQQLEGFQSIYQLNAESKIKSKAFIAVQALENDLLNIFNIESMQNLSPEQLVLVSSVGLLQKRRGGHPLSLLFFVRPTELLNLEDKRMDSLMDALQTAAASKKLIGNSVTINLEAAAPSNKLQTAPLLIKSGKTDGNFSFNQISVHNSTMLPAAFVLRLNKGIPLSTQIVEEIKKITGNLGVFGEETTVIKLENSSVSTEMQKESPGSLVNLIVNQESQGSYDNGQKGLFVTLADQSHCYFISDNSELTGTVIKSIQFTEPAHVAKIIKLLRQQALFNALIASCVRRQNNRQDFDCYMFEIAVVNLQFIQIFVEHPIKESIVTVELDLTDVRQVSCRINGSDQQLDPKLENYILRVFQKTVSIPMVLRSLIKFWDNEAQEFQRLQKRLYNNGIYGSISDTKSDDKKDDKEKGGGALNGSIDDSYNGNGQDASGAFDICGINKNEIFFKTNEQKPDKRIRQDIEPTVDIFDQRGIKMARVMSFDLNDENDEMMISERNLINEDLINENSLSPTSSISSEGPGKKNVLPKSGATSQKSLDVFEFNDPSPPPANTVMVPMQSPLAEERAKKVPTPRASPSTTSPFSMDKRVHDIEMIPIKSQMEQSAIGQTSISIMPVNNTSNFVYEKPKSEKKKKRKREDGEMGSPAMVKKKSSDSLGSSPSKKSSGGSAQLMGKPTASFSVPKKSPVAGLDSIDDFLNFGVDQQTVTVASPLPSPSLLKGSSSAQANRKNSLSAVINKLKSEMSDAMTTPSGEDKKSEYQIKSSGSDGIKITFNKTKASKGSKSPKHTGLKPGVNSGPASKKSSQSSKSSSQKLLYQKSSSSGSLNSTSTTVPSPKSTSQPGKSSSKERSKEGSISPFSNFSGSSNDMLKNMLNLASPSPRTDIMKAFDKKFQIPKLSARKSDDKPSLDDPTSFNVAHPRSAPSTPIQSLTPSPTMDFMREGTSGGAQSLYQIGQQKFFTNVQQQNKFMDQQRQNKKLFKSVSSEQLYGDASDKQASSDKLRGPGDISDVDFQAFLRTQSKMSEPPMHIMKSPMRQIGLDGNMMSGGGQMSDAVNVFNDDDLMDLNFIGNEI